MPLTFSWLGLLQALFGTRSADLVLFGLCGIVLIFFLAWFYSIIKDLTFFSSMTTFFITLGLAILLAMTGIIAMLVAALLKLLGPLITTIIIFLFFTFTYFLEHLIMLRIRKSKKLREKLKAEMGEEKLRKFEELIEKKQEKK
ncbi:MAG: hypothetical protein QW199_03235 [Candidatus Pacearchaeota archaeon]